MQVRTTLTDKLAFFFFGSFVNFVNFVLAVLSVLQTTLTLGGLLAIQKW